MFSDFKIHKKRPVYLQVKDYLREMILRGMFQENEKLPSTRELSIMIMVSRNTVNYAYEYLQDEGLIYIIKGKGAFVSHVNISKQNKWSIDWRDRVTDYAKMAEKLDVIKHEVPWKKGMISFKSIAPDEKLFDSQEFKRSFLNKISVEGEKILNYGYAQGYRPLIQFLLEYMKNKGVDVKNKNIIITNGFTEGFDITLSALTKEGDKVICENPTHNTAIKIMKLHKLNIVGIKEEKDGMNTDELKTRLSDGNYKLAYLVPSYHNPTGIVMSSDKRVEIYELFKKYNIPIIEDGFNEELRYSGAHVSPIASLCSESNSVIYIGSFSKILFPGIRIGWILADDKLIDYMESIKRSRNIHTSVLDQAILCDYLENGNFEKYIKKARKFYKEKYEFAVYCAKKYIPHKQILGSGGLHIFIELDGINSRKVLEKCCDKGVIFTPGDIFYTGTGGECTFRLGFSRVTSSDIEKGFKIIGETVKELGYQGDKMNITIRQVSIKDLDAVTKVESNCFPKVEAATKDSLEQRINTFPQSFFVAKIDGKIIGFVNGCVINGIVIYDNLFKDSSLHIPDGAYQTIFGLDVIPEYRNQGIAAKLMNHMIEVARTAGRRGVILTCKEKLIHYYQKFGYINKGVSDSVHGGAKWYDMILEFSVSEG